MSQATLPTVKLVVAQGKPAGKVIPVPGPRFVIGRDESCQLRPHSEQVSRRHAELTLTDRSVTIQDLGSRNGTVLNGKRVTEPTPMSDGDRLQVGPLTFTVSIQGLAAARAPAPSAKAPAAKKPAAKATAPAPSSDDDIAAWLISDEEGEVPERASGVFGGLTRATDEDEEPADPDRSARADESPDDAGGEDEGGDTSSSAEALLRAMTIRGKSSKS